MTLKNRVQAFRQKLLDLSIERVYYQPPPNFQMEYPCVRFTVDSSQLEYASNKVYKSDYRLLVTVIDKNPTSDIVDKLTKIGLVMSRKYVAQNLHHFTFIAWI